MRTTSRASAVAILSLTSGLLVGCSGITWNPPPGEVFEFKYQLVQESSPGIYLVVDDEKCMGTSPRSLGDIARYVQAIGGNSGYNALWTCAASYLVTGADAAAIRSNPTSSFGFDVRGTSSIRIDGTRTFFSGASPAPTGILLTSGAPLQVGPKLASSSAEIYFGTAGPVFRCAGGAQPWHANIAAPATDTFFELALTELDLNNGVAGGNFQCLARNVAEASDKRLLIILGGGFRVFKD